MADEYDAHGEPKRSNAYDGVPIDSIKETHSAPRGFVQELKQGMPGQAIQRTTGPRNEELESFYTVHPAISFALNANTDIANRLLNDQVMGQLDKMRHVIKEIVKLKWAVADQIVSTRIREELLPGQAFTGLTSLEDGLAKIIDGQNSIKHSLRTAAGAERPDDFNKPNPNKPKLNEMEAQMQLLTRGVEILESNDVRLSLANLSEHAHNHPLIGKNLVAIQKGFAALAEQLPLAKNLADAVNDAFVAASANVKLARDTAKLLPLSETDKITLKETRDARLKLVAKHALPGYTSAPRIGMAK